MTQRLIVRRGAEADILEAALWYQRRSPGLGLEFLRAVDVALAEIERKPSRFPLVYKQARRVILPRFPYAVFFVESQDRISVLACIHAHRDPRSWQQRVENDR